MPGSLTRVKYLAMVVCCASMFLAVRPSAAQQKQDVVDNVAAVDWCESVREMLEAWTTSERSSAHGPLSASPPLPGHGAIPCDWWAAVDAASHAGEVFRPPAPRGLRVDRGGLSGRQVVVVQVERTPGRFEIGLGVADKPKPIAGCFLNDLSSFPVTDKGALEAFGDPRQVLVQRDGQHGLRLFAVSTSGLSIPRIYRLNVDRTVSIDVAATRREASRMAKLYAVASGEHQHLYRVASLAYEAFGARRQCVTRP